MLAFADFAGRVEPSKIAWRWSYLSSHWRKFAVVVVVVVVAAVVAVVVGLAVVVVIVAVVAVVADVTLRLAVGPPAAERRSVRVEVLLRPWSVATKVAFVTVRRD